MKRAETRIVNTSNKSAVTIAVDAIRSGAVIAFPTDTVYGLGADLMIESAIEEIYSIKGRDVNKPIAVLISDVAQLSQLTASINPSAMRLAEQFWPGGLTLVIEKREGLPEALTSTATIGVRMPAHPFALALISRTGPLATTSANLSGGSNCITAEEVLAQLDGRIRLVIDGGACPTAAASTVVDCTGPTPKILRQGAISAEALGI